MKGMLAAAALSTMILRAVPAGATTLTISRTIVAPTTFGTSGGTVVIPDVLLHPTEPNRWRKLGVAHTAARCGYVKQEVEHVMPPGTAQDESLGMFGYVYQLPSGFGSSAQFSLAADPSNPNFDFDIIFYNSLGVCLPDVTIRTPSFDGCGSKVTISIEGSEPRPPPREVWNPTPPASCDDPVRDVQSAFTRIGDDSGQLMFNADYAVVVMPIGVNGMFDLTLMY